MFYIAQYPVRWTAQSTLHFSSPGRPVHSDTNSASLGSILAMQQLRKDYPFTFPPLSIGTHLYSWVDWGVAKRTKMPKLRNGFERGLSRLRVRHSTTELWNWSTYPAEIFRLGEGGYYGSTCVGLLWSRKTPQHMKMMHVGTTLDPLSCEETNLLRLPVDLCRSAAMRE